MERVCLVRLPADVKGLVVAVIQYDEVTGLTKIVREVAAVTIDAVGIAFVFNVAMPMATMASCVALYLFVDITLSNVVQ